MVGCSNIVGIVKGVWVGCLFHILYLWEMQCFWQIVTVRKVRSSFRILYEFERAN